MGIGKVINLIVSKPDKKPSNNPNIPPNSFLQDIYFTANFHAKAKEWGLTEEHARRVYYEGDPVKGKENMRVMTYRGEEIGIYVFHDRLTNQPVVTSIWKRPASKSGR